MVFFRLMHRLAAPTHPAICIAAVLALVTTTASAQSQTAIHPAAILQGTVRDSGDHPVAGAKVHLQSKDPGPILTVSTDAEGHYRFLAPLAGTYTLRAEETGYGEATVNSVILSSSQTRTIDLKLAKASSSRSVEVPEFFDEPHFTVAGVSDTTNLGGHGSDVVVRTTEGLARDTASLGRSQTISRQSEDAASPAEKSLRAEVERDPGNFEANHRFGTLLVDNGHARDALPYLEQASRLRPSDDGNAYELTLARANSADLERAHADVKVLLARHDTAELHHLLADVEEKQGSPVEAVREYQRAAELDPSESNLFDWGADLLLHTAVEPALEVFGKGNRDFPQSERMLVGLGVAWYARGSYEQAVKYLGEASDLDPDDATPYLFLGKFQSVDSTPSPESVEKLARFAALQPENAQANYYYAVSLWNRRQGSGSTNVVAQVRSLLEKAVRIDPKLGGGFLQLGILYAEQNDLPKAVSTLQKAVEASPQLLQAHYRLAQAYRQAGDLPRAQKELELYERISRESAEQSVRERREIQQFVYTLRDGPSAPQPQ